MLELRGVDANSNCGAPGGAGPVESRVSLAQPPDEKRLMMAISQLICPARCRELESSFAFKQSVCLYSASRGMGSVAAADDVMHVGCDG